MLMFKEGWGITQYLEAHFTATILYELRGRSIYRTYEVSFMTENAHKLLLEFTANIAVTRGVIGPISGARRSLGSWRNWGIARLPKGF